MPIQSIQLEGHIPAEQEKTYIHLPFDMPPNALRLEIEYSYDAQISSDPTALGGNTVDLGLFDERGTDFLTAGFRGWSGSERLEISIDADTATPGYLPGRLNPGVWNVLLGLYKMAPQGLQYHVAIRITTLPGGSARPQPPADSILKDLPGSLPPAAQGPWLRGELHCHTWHSDGKLTPQELIQRARQRGLDFIAVTDHNTTASQREMERMDDPGILLIRGVESTTFKGHFNAWGIPDWIDFRVQAPADMRAVLQRAADLGALTSCGHPKPIGPDWDYRDVDNFQCVEVWNGPWTGFNEMSLEYWTSLLAAGRRIPAVGGSDFHREGEKAGGQARDLGTPTNWVFVPGAASAGSILEAVRLGHTSLSDAPDGPFLDLRAGDGFAAMAGDALGLPLPPDLPVQVHCLRAAGCTLQLLDQRGRLFEQVIQSEDELVMTTLPITGSFYVRAELRDADEHMHALTNPVYLTGGNVEEKQK